MPKNKLLIIFSLLAVIVILGAALCFSKIFIFYYPKEQTANSTPMPKKGSEISVSTTPFIINDKDANINDFNKYSGDKSCDRTYNVYSAQELSINNQVGNITLYEDEVKDLTLTTSISAKASSQEEVDHLIENVMISAEVDNGIFKIRVLSEKDKTDYWNWKTSTYPLSQVDIEFDVIVPKKFTSFDINDSTGDIKLSDISGKLKVYNLTGDINVINANLVGDNIIDVKTGNITAKTDISTAKALSINTMTGNINLTVLKDRGISIDASLMTGNIGEKYKGGFTVDENLPGMKSVSKVYNGGGTNVTLKTMTGDISVD